MGADDTVQPWRNALADVCRRHYEQPAAKRPDWLLVGSLASALHGCNIQPGDLDILTPSKAAAEYFTGLLEDCPADYPLTRHAFSSGFAWYKGQYRVMGFPVEIVYILKSGGIPDSTDGDGIWEGGRYVWKLRQELRFGEWRVPAVPLEVQLESNIRRPREQRVREIIRRLGERGFDRNLLNRSLSNGSLARPDVQALLQS